jgi:hypothetical protein
MSTVWIETVYTLSAVEPVELPEGKTWSDVKSYGVKWGTLYVTFNDDTEWETNLEGPSMENADWKRPDDVNVYGEKDGYADFENDLEAA